MNIIFHNSDPYFNNNKIFSESQTHQLLYPIYLLKKVASREGYKLLTSDLVKRNEKTSKTLHIYFDMPKKKLFSKRKLPKPEEVNSSILFLWECPLIRKDNFIRNLHNDFYKVLTWSQDLINEDKEKYIKTYFCRSLDFFEQYHKVKKRKLLTCISGNKVKSGDGELYSERLKFIKWLEKNSPDEFDLYGKGWDSLVLDSNLPIRVFNPILKKISFNSNLRKSWRGSVDNKLLTLSQYKFNICFENSCNYDDYITEKILDSLIAGSIPIYYGAPNISDYIPKECYIDYRDFDSFYECHNFIRSMSDKEIKNKRESIKKFLLSKEATKFDSDFFISQVLKIAQEIL